jgi:hypothetical protein
VADTTTVTDTTIPMADTVTDTTIPVADTVTDTTIPTTTTITSATTNTTTGNGNNYGEHINCNLLVISFLMMVLVIII